MSIPFNRPYMSGKELEYIKECHQHSQLAGDGPFTKKCHEWLEQQSGTPKALLTHSCTAALEMAALLLDIQPGDEIIMPSYTFVSTANAFALRGGIPVFVDIRTDTLNLDESKIEDAITAKTKAIVPVHYAGVACEMDTIMAIAKRHALAVVEDAAQGVMSTYKGRPLGSIGDFGAYSFHETKNVISGEGGALLVNQAEAISQAEIIREKGTDRSQFFRGQIDKYTWQDLGSSFLPGELIAAFLWAQLEHANEITQHRLSVWDNYHSSLAELESKGVLRRPVVPVECNHNGHMYYIITNTKEQRKELLQKMGSEGINGVFHYVPLHDSPAGKRYGRCHGELTITEDLAHRLVRLPLWVGIDEAAQEIVSRVVNKVLK